MEIEIKNSASAKGSGKLKGDTLKAFANVIPDNAVVDVISHKAQDQRDNDRWELHAEWVGPVKPAFTHRPGYRDGGGRNDA